MPGLSYLDGLNLLAQEALLAARYGRWAIRRPAGWVQKDLGRPLARAPRVLWPRSAR